MSMNSQPLSAFRSRSRLMGILGFEAGDREGSFEGLVGSIECLRAIVLYCEKGWEDGSLSDGSKLGGETGWKERNELWLSFGFGEYA
jgi:hypothetical protein